MTVLVQTYPRKEIRRVNMRDLRVGDRVLTHLDPQTGQPIYEAVYAFGHRDPDTLAHFFILTNKHDLEERPLEVTDRHLVYLSDQIHPSPVHQLQADTALLLHQKVADEGKLRYYDNDEPGNPVEVVPLKSISEGYRRGLYQPLTKSGTIVVNNILCSTHAYPVHPPIRPDWYKHARLDEFVLEDPLFVFVWMAPYRVVCSWGWFHCQGRAS